MAENTGLPGWLEGLASFITGPGVDLGSGIWQYLLASDQANYQRELTQRQQQNAEKGLGQLETLSPTLWNTLLTNAGNADMNLWGNEGFQGQISQQQDALKGLQALVPQLFSQSNLRQMSPEIADVISNLQGFQGLVDPAVSQAQGLLTSQGSTYDTQALRDTLWRNINGQGAMGSFADLGQDLLGRRGVTEFTQGTQKAGQAAQNTGGYNGALEALLGNAFGLVENNGMTADMASALPTLQALISGGGKTDLSQAVSALGLGGAGLNAGGVPGQTAIGGAAQQTALEALLSGGAKPGTEFLQSLGADIAGKPTTLSLADAAAFARNTSGTAAKNAAATARRQALARGGGPGAIAAGSQNEALTDFADQALQAESAALQSALLGQQGVLGQEQSRGIQALLGGLGTEATNYGNAADLMKGLESTATQRYGTGGNLALGAGGLEQALMGTGLQGLTSLLGLGTQRQLGGINAGTNIDQAAAQRMLGLTNAGNAAYGNEITATGLGGNLLNQFYNVQGSNTNDLLKMLSGETANMGLAGNLLGSSANYLSGNANSILNAVLQNAGLNNTLANSQLNAAQAPMNQNSALMQLLTGLQSSAWGNQNNLLNNWTQIATKTPTYNPVSVPNPLQQLAQGNNQQKGNSILDALKGLFKGSGTAGTPPTVSPGTTIPPQSQPRTTTGTPSPTPGNIEWVTSGLVDPSTTWENYIGAGGQDFWNNVNSMYDWNSILGGGATGTGSGDTWTDEWGNQWDPQDWYDAGYGETGGGFANPANSAGNTGGYTWAPTGGPWEYDMGMAGWGSPGSPGNPNDGTSFDQWIEDWYAGNP